MFANFRKISNDQKFLWTLACLALFMLGGCAAKFVSRTSFDRAQLQQENIQKVAVFVFESSYIDMQAGTHISRLFELNLQQSGMYKIVERAEIEKVLRERGMPLSPAAPPLSLRQLGDLLKVDGVVLGSVSQYNRFNLGFTARLVSVKSGLVLWSVSQTGGRIFTPLSQVADETVKEAVLELQAKLR
jgi:curli biogenesis system outer membrane secretion channel CsgG